MLGNTAILARMEAGSIIIDPFDEKALGPNSYDVTLGPNIFRQVETGVPFTDITPHLKRGEPVDSKGMWQEFPIDYSEQGYIDIEPHELILAHTNERIACFEHTVAEMKSRSTIMRSGIAICIDAGLGDVGYDGKWTMEIFNHLETTVRLDIGIRIGQMVFFDVGGISLNYKEKGGTYSQDVEWHPFDMLPRSRV